MKTFTWFTLALFSLNTAMAASDDDLKASLTAAARKLADQPNYAWVSTPKLEGTTTFRQGPTQGTTEKAGFTSIRMTFGDNTIESAFQGTNAAINLDGNWTAAAELDGDRAWIAGALRAFRAPAAEAEFLLKHTTGLNKDADGGISGNLTEAGVKELLTFGRRLPNVEGPRDARGWVKYWVKDGMLSRYEFNTQGHLTSGGQTPREIDVNRTTNVEINGVGSTKVTVPDAAREKLK